MDFLQVKALLSQKDYFIRHLESFIYASSLFVRRCVAAVIAFFLARYLSVAEFGLYSSLVSISLILLVVANLGYNEYLLVISKNNREKVVNHIIGFSFIGFIFLLLISAIIGLSGYEHKFIFILILMKMFIDTKLSIVTFAYFQAENKFFEIGIINILYSIVVSLAIGWCYFNKISLEGFLALNVTAGIIFIFVQFLYMDIKIKNYFSDLVYFFRNLKKDIIYFALSFFTFDMYYLLPSFLAAVFLLKEQTALFFAAFNIAQIFVLIAQAQMHRMIPEFITLDKEKTAVIIKNNLLYLIIVNLLIFILFIFTGKSILQVVYSKSEYLSSFPLLMIFLAGNVFYALSIPFLSYVIAKGHQKKRIMLQLEFFAVSLVFVLLTFKFLDLYLISGLYAIMCGYVFVRYRMFYRQQNDI
jgi:O-antigen/teichoic acid export membrane protein